MAGDSDETFIDLYRLEARGKVKFGFQFLIPSDPSDGIMVKWIIGLLGLLRLDNLIEDWYVGLVTQKSDILTDDHSQTHNMKYFEDAPDNITHST